MLKLNTEGGGGVLKSKNIFRSPFRRPAQITRFTAKDAFMKITKD